MYANEYQDLAYRTANTQLNSMEQLRNAVYGLNGEAGEVIDVLKKYEFQGHEFDRDKFVDELGDVAWYLALACTALGVSLSYVLTRNIDKLKARYPDGFDTEKSVHRKE